MTSQYATATQLDLRLPNETLDPAVAAQLITAASSALDEQLTFSYGGDIETHIADGGSSTRILLPPPGAELIVSVVEDGGTLVSGLYIIDPRQRRRLIRLDADGVPMLWANGRRNITVQYVPTAPPAALTEACLELATIMWHGKEGGYADTVGVQGSTEMTYRRALPDSARLLCRSLREKNGVRRR